MVTGLKIALQCRDAYGTEDDPKHRHSWCSFFRPRGVIPHSIGKNYDSRCVYSAPLGGGVSPQVYLCTCEEARYEYEKYEADGE